MPPFADYRPDAKRNLSANFNHPTILHIRQSYSSDHLVHLTLSTNPPNRQPHSPTIFLIRPPTSTDSPTFPTTANPTTLLTQPSYSPDQPTHPTNIPIRPTSTTDYPTHLTKLLARQSIHTTNPPNRSSQLPDNPTHLTNLIIRSPYPSDQPTQHTRPTQPTHPTILITRLSYSSDHLILSANPPTDNPTHRQSFSSDHPPQPTVLLS